MFAPPVPTCALLVLLFPSLLHHLDRHRGQQPPRKPLHSLRRVRFPHAHHPHHQWTQGAFRVALWRQQAQGAETEREVSRAGSGLLGCIQVQVLLPLGRPAAHYLEQMLLRAALVMGAPRRWRLGLLNEQIHTAVLCRSYVEVAVPLPTARQKGEHITVAIPDADPVHSCWGFADRLHTSSPPLRFPLPP